MISDKFDFYKNKMPKKFGGFGYSLYLCIVNKRKDIKLTKY